MGKSTRFSLTNGKPLSIPSVNPYLVQSRLLRTIEKFWVSTYCQCRQPGIWQRFQDENIDFRTNHRQKGLKWLFKSISKTLGNDITIDSDEHPVYASLIKHYFQQASYRQKKRVRSAVTGKVN